MATLQKFKMLALQCAISGSPTQSPTSSPVIHLRRRKTLRMFLSRDVTNRRLIRSRDVTNSTDDDDIGDNSAEKTVRNRRKLKDLLMTSSPPLEDTGDVSEGKEHEWLLPAAASGSGFNWRRGSNWRRSGGVGSLRPLTAAFRNRVLRRAWRPVLVTIPE